MKRINYVIARKWDHDSESLCVYTYHTEVHYDTVENAEKFAKDISKKTGEKYEVYELIPL